jgi:hypothetical protein
MINKRGQKAGSQRGDRRRFPYEPRVVGGKLLMPLEAIHRYVVETPILKAVLKIRRMGSQPHLQDARGGPGDRRFGWTDALFRGRSDRLHHKDARDRARRLAPAR